MRNRSKTSQNLEAELGALTQGRANDVLFLIHG